MKNSLKINKLQKKLDEKYTYKTPNYQSLSSRGISLYSGCKAKQNQHDQILKDKL